MRIDVHTHFMSEQVARTLEKRSQFPYTRFVDGTYHFHCCQGLSVPMSPPLRDMRRKLEDMDSAGIDVAYGHTDQSSPSDFSPPGYRRYLTPASLSASASVCTALARFASSSMR